MSSGISMFTAMEIFTNPHDLEITVAKEGRSGKFAFAISRGPGHRFKRMLSSRPFAETLENVVFWTKVVLEGIRQTVIKEFEDNGSLLSQHLNPDGQTIDQSKVLNPDLINRIVNELRKHQTASTYRMPATAS